MNHCALEASGVLLALGAVTLICGRLFGFNSPFVFWGGVAVVVGGASAAYANVLVKARSIQLASDLRSVGMKSYDRSDSGQRLQFTATLACNLRQWVVSHPATLTISPLQQSSTASKP
jgi:hypothetical protein